MIYIAHRGNINGPSELENHPDYIQDALRNGYDVEVDLWYINDEVFLGHDSPQYKIDYRWLRDRISSLWIHCKNIDALYFLSELGYEMNYFWHQEDDVTITSTGYFWTYPGKQLTSNSIAVMPEIEDFKDINIAYGICSDYIYKIKDEYDSNSN